MQNPNQILKYIQISIDGLVAAGRFPGGQIYKPTQAKALQAFKNILNDETIPIEDRLNRFFVMPQGTGKTPFFLGIIAGAMEAAEQDGGKLRSMIVAPTNKILSQTVKRAKEFFPGLEEKIGVYGDKQKERRKPITVITYDSWLDLTEEGILTEDNIDILISDEGHRGTSERRIASLSKEFQNVAKYAFTATPEFNKVKGVALTHGLPAYIAKFKDSIEIGELAAYYQTLFYIIRVLPAPFDVIAKAKEHGLKNYESERRKQAWSERIVSILRDTIDPQTGDPISDNQGAIFCRDTAHADATAALLNADPVLKVKASALGMKGVCVSVHSRLGRSLHRDNLDSYEAGEYLFITGDEQLKEGWDYPPAKTLVDYYHHSLVDKVQILGRVGREWENPVKGRMEGAIAIDILTYTGHQDPKIDALRRKEALQKAVLAWEIMEDVVVLGPNHKAPELSDKPNPGKRFTPPEISKIIGQEIEAYTTLASLQTIRAEYGNLRALGEYIEITPEIREKLKSEIIRTSLSNPEIAGTSATVRKLPDDLKERPEGLTAAVIQNWTQNSKIGNKVQIEWVLKYLSLMPNDPKIEITNEILNGIKNKFKAVKISAGQLTRNCDDLPEDLHENKINRWLGGSTTHEKKRLIDYVVAKLDDVIEGRLKVTVYPQMAFNRTGYKHLYKLTQNDKEKLWSLSEATGLGSTEILKYADDKKPNGLTRDMIDLWKRETSANADKDLLDYTISLYEKTLKGFQDKGYDPKKVEISSAVRQQMIEWNETITNGVVARTKGAPEDLKRSIIYCWLTGDATTARKYHLDFVLETWPKLVDQKILAKAAPVPSGL